MKLGRDAVIRVIQNLMQELLRPDIELVEFLQQVMDQTLDLLESDVGWLLLKEGDWLRIVATDKDHTDDIGRRFLIDDCISGWSMLRGEAINIPDLANMPAEFKRVYKSPAGRAMKSELVLPLWVGDTAVGAFNIESDQERTFETHHVETLDMLASQVAVAVALARSRQEAAALSSVGLDLSRQAEMDAVVRSVLAHALDLVQGQFGQLLLREGTTLVVRYTTNKPPVDLDLAVDIDDSIVGLAIHEARPVIVPDVAKTDYQVANLVADEPGWTGDLIQNSMVKPLFKRALEVDKASMHAEFCVPLGFQGEVIGALNVETPRRSGFTVQQRQALLDFVGANAERFSAVLLPSEPVPLMELLQEALITMDTSFGQILRLEGDILVIEQTTGEEGIGTYVLVNKSVTGRAIQFKSPVYVPDVAMEADYQRYLGDEIKSELAVPLFIGDEAVGVLNVESPMPGFFTLEHARILEAFAGQAAVAIDRARRVESEKFAELGSLAGDIVHRLNNPLGAIGMRLDLLKRKSFYADLLSDYPYLGQFMEQTEAELNTAKATIQELRSALKDNRPQLSLIPLKPAIDEALEKAGLPESVTVRVLLVQEDLQVYANDRLTNVFWNLFDNARKAMPDGGVLTIDADLSADGKLVEIQVADRGTGIEPWRLDSVFEPGETSPVDSYAPAHGLGLWWTHAQVESFGGSIQAESGPGVGTMIRLRLLSARGR